MANVRGGCEALNAATGTGKFVKGLCCLNKEIHEHCIKKVRQHNFHHLACRSYAVSGDAFQASPTAFWHRLHFLVSRKRVCVTISCSCDAMMPHSNWRFSESASRCTTLLSLCWYIVRMPQDCWCLLSWGSLAQCPIWSSTSDSLSAESESELDVDEEDELLDASRPGCSSVPLFWGTVSLQSSRGFLDNSRPSAIWLECPNTYLSEDSLESAQRGCEHVPGIDLQGSTPTAVVS